MSLSIYGKQNIEINTTQKGSANTAAAEVNPKDIKIFDFECDKPEDTVKTETSASTSLKATNTEFEKKILEELKISKEKLTQIIQEYNKVHNANITSITQFVALVVAKNEAKLSEKEYEKCIISLKAAIEDYEKDNKIDIARRANDYYITTMSGWEVETLRKHLNASNGKEDLLERLQRVYPALKNETWDTISDETLEHYFEQYFIRYFDSLVESGKKTKEEMQVLQVTEFSKLIMTTNPKYREKFINVIPKLLASNRAPGIEAVFNSIQNNQARTNLADAAIENGLLDEIYNEKDYFGDKISNEDYQKVVYSVSSRNSSKGLETHRAITKERSEEFYNDEKNLETLKNIKTKQENGEKLTQEEEDLLRQLQQYKSTYSGIITGSANNTNINDVERKQFMANVNNDVLSVDESFYREVLQTVSEYVNNNQDSLATPLEEFNALMEEVTNYNYGIVENDYLNGTTTELNPAVDVESMGTQSGNTNSDKEQGAKSAAQNSDAETDYSSNTYTTSPIVGNTGFATNPYLPKYNNYEEIYKEILKPATENPITQNTVKAESISDVIKEKGLFTAIKEILKSPATTTTAAVNFLKNCYAKLNPTMQKHILQSVDGETLAFLLPETDIETLNMLPNFASAYTNKLIEEEKNAREEKNGVKNSAVYC